MKRTEYNSLRARFISTMRSRRLRGLDWEQAPPKLPKAWVFLVYVDGEYFGTVDDKHDDSIPEHARFERVESLYASEMEIPKTYYTYVGVMLEQIAVPCR